MRQSKLFRQCYLGVPNPDSINLSSVRDRHFRLIRLVLFALCFLLLNGCSYFSSWTFDDDEDTSSEVEAKSSTAEQSAIPDKVESSQEGDKKPATDAKKMAESSTIVESSTIAEKTSPDVKTDIKPDTPDTKADVKTSQPDKADGADKKQQTATDQPAETPVTTEKPVASKPKNPNEFVITVEDKDPNHPFYGRGYPKGFLVNNVPGNHIVMERGKTYTLDVMTDPLHDVYLSRKEIGWGSSAWTQGVTGQFIYSGIITVNPAKETPSTLFYACRNHPFMGGQIYVVDKGEKPNIKKHVALSKKAVAANKKNKKITKGMVEQKLMFASMLIKSKTTERVKKSNNKVALKLQSESIAAIENGKKELAKGRLKQAFSLVEKGVDGLKEVKKLVPSEGQLSLLKEQYTELLHSIENFEKSHKKNYQNTVKKKGKDAAVDYDHDKVKALKVDAEKAVKGTNYAKANKLLEKAQRHITVAIKKMMDSQTVVYDLNFETAEEEYDYELRRFKGYEILIPIAVKMKRPSEGAQKLMNTYLEKGRKMRAAAMKKAKEKDFPTAIAMLLDATKEVRRALRMIGITQ